MAARIRRLGTRRTRGEGLRLGTVRRLPRGVRKADYARRDYFDLWLPELAPSAKLLAYANAAPWTAARWRKYSGTYLREMREPSARRLLDLLARLSRRTNFSVGCYCEDEKRCHRSILRALLAGHGARLAR
jgi:uncharacterized protein YeaO (DUF488 family)